MDWQPIEDSTTGVYLVCSTKDVAEGDYTVETMQINDASDPKHRFFNLNSGNYSRSDWWTHYMPLPDPPR